MTHKTDSSPPSVHESSFSFLDISIVVLAAMMLGFAAIFVRLSETGPVATALWRVLLAMPLLTVWVFFPSRSKKQHNADLKKVPPWKGFAWAALSGLVFAADLATWHQGIVRTTAANATLLGNMTPLVVAAAGWFFFKERFGPVFFLALGLALLGALCLSGANLSLAPERIWGDILSILTAFWYGAYILTIKAARQTLSTGMTMFVSGLFSIPALFLLSLLFQDTIRPPDLQAWLPLLGLALLVHIGGQGGLAYALGRLPAALASVIILIQPATAAVLGWIFFDEVLGPLGLIGFILVAVGITLARLSPPRKEEENTPS